ncbi:unnamed protein product [Oppiella nova]|uniref:Uncharacterized protein n=1 Tax=Oppiella nova TaxID=334625 RepID=A0A7R9MV67_9ACAR|nr:unnamed protein product [Oppiella nova]CAG2183830.1 unnamed protein product [Oppiella nova]
MAFGLEGHPFVFTLIAAFRFPYLMANGYSAVIPLIMEVLLNTFAIRTLN